MSEQSQRIHIDPDNPPIKAISDLLVAAFTAEGLRRFCRYRPDLTDVVNQFGSSAGLADMVYELIEYCRTRLLWDTLLEEVAKENPNQYARFEPRILGQSTPLRSEPVEAPE